MAKDEGGATMKIYWWQGSLHIEPESDEDRVFLVESLEVLERVRINQEIPASPFVAVQTSNEKPVV